jgi:hypothetical protein
MEEPLRELARIFAAVMVLTLVGCQQQQPVVSDSKSLSTEQIFRMKLECSKFVDKLYAEEKANPMMEKVRGKSSFFVFYSEPRNTCIALTRSSAFEPHLSANLLIQDILTGETLWSEYLNEDQLKIHDSTTELYKEVDKEHLR